MRVVPALLLIYIWSTQGVLADEPYLDVQKSLGTCLGTHMRLAINNSNSRALSPETLDAYLSDKCGHLEQKANDEFSIFLGRQVGKPLTAEIAFQIELQLTLPPRELRRLAVDAYKKSAAKKYEPDRRVAQEFTRCLSRHAPLLLDTKVAPRGFEEVAMQRCEYAAGMLRAALHLDIAKLTGDNILTQQERQSFESEVETLITKLRRLVVIDYGKQYDGRFKHRKRCNPPRFTLDVSSDPEYDCAIRE